MARPLLDRIKKSQNYNKPNIEGIIIYVDSSNKWCNVKDYKGNTYYRVYFGEGVSNRLRRKKQSVLMAQSILNRYQWVIIGAAGRRPSVTDFASKGVFDWNDSGITWDDGHAWA